MMKCGLLRAGVIAGVIAGVMGLGQVLVAEEAGDGGDIEASIEEMREKAKEQAAREAKEAAEAGEERTGGIGEQIGTMMPKGEEARNVTIPSFEGGVLSSLTEAEVVAFSEDSEDDLEMTDMTIQLFDGEGGVELVIELETAGYNIPTGLLESDTKARVKNEQIDLVGDQLIYDTTTRKGKLLRPTMFVFGPDESTKGEDAAAPATPETETVDE
ncbi:MAG: hypothetical protein AAF591_12150 [Verrucomicrobiota bacterium]